MEIENERSRAMNIGLIDADRTGFPNLALMKLASYHKSKGDTVGWYTPFEQYDIVYKSKVFTFTRDENLWIDNAETVIKAGTGYNIYAQLPDESEYITPDYSIYTGIGKETAYGYLTRGCPNKCPWCIVPIKEGPIRPYMDVDQVASGRKKLILMDNNILGSGEYGRGQLLKIIERGYRVDFNQAMDARLVDDEIAEILSRIKWIRHIRFGCDTQKQLKIVDHAIEKIIKHGYKGQFVLYTMLHGDIKECYHRLSYWKNSRFSKQVILMAQPYMEYKPRTVIPQWQKDMARWANRRWIYKSCDFNDYSPRKGITGKDLLIMN